MTDVPLLKHIESRLDAIEARITRSEAEQRVSIKLAADALQARLTAMNEFREQLTRERGEYVRRDQLIWLVVALVSIGLAVAQYLRR